MRVFGKQLLCGLSALALLAVAEAAANDSCMTDALAPSFLCLEPIADETLVSVAGTGAGADGAALDGNQTETAIILWDELQRPRTPAGGPAKAMATTETGIRLNLGEFTAQF